MNLQILLALLRLALAAVLAMAGVMKLRDFDRTREDFEAMGLPAWLVPTLSFRLPIIELAVAAMLLIEPLAGVGAASALGLMGLFTIVIAINLWRGRRPTCACFGSLTRARIGPATLARNACLMVAAGALLLPPPTGASNFVELSPAAVLIGALAILGCAVLFGAWWVFQLWRQQGRLLVRIEQLEQRSHTAARAEPQAVPLPRPPELVGQPAPALTLHDVTGRRIDLQSLRGKPAVLLFLDSTCKHCRPLLSRLRTWSPEAHVIIVLAGQQRDVPTVLEFAAGIAVVTEDASSAMQAIGVYGTPAAISIDASGIVTEPVARGNAAVTRLLDRLTDEPQATEARHELATI